MWEEKGTFSLQGDDVARSVDGVRLIRTIAFHNTSLETEHKIKSISFTRTDNGKEMTNVFSITCLNVNYATAFHIFLRKNNLSFIEHSSETISLEVDATDFIVYLDKIIEFDKHFLEKRARLIALFSPFLVAAFITEMPTKTLSYSTASTKRSSSTLENPASTTTLLATGLEGAVMDNPVKRSRPLQYRP